MAATLLKEHVRDLVHKPGRMREETFDVAFRERIGEGLAAVPANEPVHVDARFESVHEGILASGVIETRADATCSRCLDEFSLPLRIDFVELFAYDRAEDSDESPEDPDYLVENDSVDLEPVVRDAVVLALPFQPVCRPDCAGLDPETGKKLAPGAEWNPAEDIDPRWAGLRGFHADNDGSSVEDGA